MATRGFQKTDRRKAGEHRDPKECSGLAFRKIRRAVDEVAEASIADLFGGVLYILGRRINATGGERRIAFESPGGIPDVTSEALDEIGSAALLFA